MISVFIERLPGRLTATTPDEIDDALKTVIAGPAEFPQGTVEDPHVISDLYFGDVSGDEDDLDEPARSLHVSVHPLRRLGALSFVDYDGETLDAQESYNPAAPAGEGRLLYSIHSGNEFSAQAALPLGTVSDAIREFACTGQRPTSLQWRPATLI